MNSNDGMVMWLLGGTGVFLLYSAYKNQQPQALLTAHINGTPADKPISNYTATVAVPTITTPDGKTYNTAPGAGGYITTDPPVPGKPSGSDSPYMLGSYGTRRDISGTYNLVDSTGRMIGVVPDKYQGTPNLYIPTVRA